MTITGRVRLEVTQSLAIEDVEMVLTGRDLHGHIQHIKFKVKHQLSKQTRKSNIDTSGYGTTLNTSSLYLCF
jgi:hypothetical protein